MIEEKLAPKNDLPDVFFEVDGGEFVKVNLSLPLQILFDDVISFVSSTEI